MGAVWVRALSCCLGELGREDGGYGEPVRERKRFGWPGEVCGMICQRDEGSSLSLGRIKDALMLRRPSGKSPKRRGSSASFGSVPQNSWFWPFSGNQYRNKRPCLQSALHFW